MTNKEALPDDNINGNTRHGYVCGGERKYEW